MIEKSSYQGELAAFIDLHASKNKLSKTELAKRSGISRQSLYKIINGDVRQTYISTMVSLANALRVHPISLMQKAFVEWGYDTPKEIAERRDTGFVGDITFPDNSLVKTGQRFEKVWEVQNLGTLPWQGCSLKCLDAEDIMLDAGPKPVSVGLVPEQRLVPIPTVNPGGTIRISVVFTAPSVPATVYSYWKMVDDQGQFCFPSRTGLYCLVRVVTL